jgi:hypothetical protein
MVLLQPISMRCATPASRAACIISPAAHVTPQVSILAVTALEDVLHVSAEACLHELRNASLQCCLHHFTCSTHNSIESLMASFCCSVSPGAAQRQPPVLPASFHLQSAGGRDKPWRSSHCNCQLGAVHVSLCYPVFPDIPRCGVVFVSGCLYLQTTQCPD